MPRNIKKDRGGKGAVPDLSLLGRVKGRNQCTELACARVKARLSSRMKGVSFHESLSCSKGGHTG
eukprot:5451166-Pleurochrysis_carterae.AAC.1